MADCTECGDYFDREPDEGWKRLCLPCWIRNKREQEKHYSDSVANVLAGWSSIPDAEVEISNLKASNSLMAHDISLLRMEVKTLQTQLRMERTLAQAFKPSSSTGGFVKEHIKDFLMLCHPDRHKNSRKATEITSWLIDFKRRC